MSLAARHASRRRGAAPRPSRPGPAGPRVYLHIGEPKTGTTFLQDVLWRNRDLLAARGIVLPGYERRDHVRARRDLRGEVREAGDLAHRWEGEWDVLAAQAMCAPAGAVISDEMLATCTPAQAGRAAASLAAAQLHVVLTVRAFPAILPAHWQEVIKCGGTVGWPEWLARIAAADPARRRGQFGFWAAHDTLEIVRTWGRHVPAGRLHVITTPRPASPQLLWGRFAAVLGIEAGGVDLSAARANSSLGYPQAELLRRINAGLAAAVPDWFYTRQLKPVLGEQVLPALPGGAPPVLPPELQAWAQDQARRLTAGLGEAGCHLAGDLTELLPAAAALPVPPPRAAGPLSPPDPPGAPEPGGQAAGSELMLTAAVASAVGLAGRFYQTEHPPRRPRRNLGGPRLLARKAGWRLLNGRWLLRQLRRGSRLAAVRRLRVLIWVVLIRPGRFRAALAQPAAHATQDVKTPAAR